MTHTIEISDDLFARLQKHAIPFVDTPVTVMERALVALEAGDEDKEEGRGIRAFNPAAPPDLKFTSVLKASVSGKSLKKSDCYWNTILMTIIASAAKNGVSSIDILDLITVNSEEGQRDDNGYKYIEAANISVQGQDSNAAWRIAYILASSFGIELDIMFAWQDHPKAVMRSQQGTFFLEGS